MASLEKHFLFGLNILTFFVYASFTGLKYGSLNAIHYIVFSGPLN